jgi:hypothetical protein
MEHTDGKHTKGGSATNYVEVYDEPDHREIFANDYVYAYGVRLPAGNSTLWHRHTQDTVYFSLAATRVREELPEDEPQVRDVPCGISLSRPHKEQPLIHRVTNASDGGFHMVGAEARARPPTTPEPLAGAGYEVQLETPRFRVYRIRCHADDTLIAPARYGLLVCARESTVRDGGGAGAAQTLSTGQVLWFTPDACWYAAPNFDGFFAEWI